MAIAVAKIRPLAVAAPISAPRIRQSKSRSRRERLLQHVFKPTHSNRTSWRQRGYLTRVQVCDLPMSEKPM